MRVLQTKPLEAMSQGQGGMWRDRQCDLCDQEPGTAVSRYIWNQNNGYSSPRATITQMGALKPKKKKKTLLSHSSGGQKGQKQGAGRVGFFWKLWGRMFHASSQLQGADGNPWSPLACGRITLLSASVFTWPPLPLCVSASLSWISYKDTRHVNVGPILI